MDIYFEKDDCLIIFYGYDSRIKQFMVWMNLIVTLAYTVTLTVSLYNLEQAYTNYAEDRAIVQTCLFGTLIYAVLMMEAFGSVVTNMLFD